MNHKHEKKLRAAIKAKQSQASQQAHFDLAIAKVEKVLETERLLGRLSVIQLRLTRDEALCIRDALEIIEPNNDQNKKTRNLALAKVEAEL